MLGSAVPVDGAHENVHHPDHLPEDAVLSSAMPLVRKLVKWAHVHAQAFESCCNGCHPVHRYQAQPIALLISRISSKISAVVSAAPKSMALAGIIT